jgi:hypothetical protein
LSRSFSIYSQVVTSLMTWPSLAHDGFCGTLSWVRHPGLSFEVGMLSVPRPSVALILPIVLFLRKPGPCGLSSAPGTRSPDPRKTPHYWIRLS